MMAPPRLPVRDRLLANHRVHGECWLWTGARTRDGYGVLGIGRRKQYRAHRVAFEVFVGAIPSGMQVCHRCDTPLCINPSHLFLGTAKENTADMWSKGRKRPLRGEAHPMAKLTDEQVTRVRELRSKGLPLSVIAESFAISFQHVSAVCRGAVRNG